MQTESISALKARSTAIFAGLKANRKPVLVTRGGKPAAYLVGVDAYDALNQKLTVLEGLARGERAIEEGRIVSHAEAKKRMTRWLS